MTSVYVCITTRDGKPDFHTIRSVDAAVRRIPEARWGFTSCPYSVTPSRNMGVVQAIGCGAKHILFVDNGIQIPEDAITNLLCLNAPIATGVTPTVAWAHTDERSEPHLNVAVTADGHPDPIWFRHLFNGPRKVRYCGASCLLIDMKVFEKVGFPWFQHKQTWDGKHYQLKTEDLDFCDRATGVGLEIVAHGDVLCKHHKQVECSRFIRHERETYGSHQAVLRRIAEKCEIRSVVEYGCGEYSTLLFLDTGVFKDVTSVDSYDSDNDWMNSIRARAYSDRLHLHYRELDELPWINPKPIADLIFIDCGAEWSNGKYSYDIRARLIHRHKTDSHIVVVHDTEDPQLAAACESSYIFSSVIPGIPNTTVLSATELAL